MEPLQAPATPQTMDPVPAVRHLSRRQSYLDLMSRIQQVRESLNFPQTTMEPLQAPAAPQTMDPVPAVRQLSRRQRYLDLMSRAQRLREMIYAVSEGRPLSSSAPTTRRSLRPSVDYPDQIARSDSIRRLLPTRTYAADGAEEEAAWFSGGFCVVCHSEFAGGESIGKLHCRHEYHSGCIQTWLLRKNYCPICRQPAFAELE